MNVALDATRYMAIETLIERALEGDEKVLRMARERANQGSRFAEWLLKEVEKTNGRQAQEVES